MFLYKNVKNTLSYAICAVWMCIFRINYEKITHIWCFLQKKVHNCCIFQKKVVTLHTRTIIAPNN